MRHAYIHIRTIDGFDRMFVCGPAGKAPEFYVLHTHRMPESDESRLKKSLCQRGRAKTEEHKRRIADALRGRPLSDDHRRALGDAHRGRPLSEAHKRALSLSNASRTLSAEHRAAISRGLRR